MADKVNLKLIKTKAQQPYKPFLGRKNSKVGCILFLLKNKFRHNENLD